MKFPSLKQAWLFWLAPLSALSCSHFMPPPEGELGSSKERATSFALIDDAEDGDDQIIIAGGRSGYIYTYVDEAGSDIQPPTNSFKTAKGGAGGSYFALRFAGETAKTGEVYVGMGFSLTEPMGLYDASRCKGVSFVAKKGPGSTSAIRFKIPDAATEPEAGVCRECYNDFGITFKVTEEWTRYVVSFADLKQEEGWGDPRPATLDVKKLYGMQWQVTTPGVTYDIWIDDIAFTDCDAD